MLKKTLLVNNYLRNSTRINRLNQEITRITGREPQVVRITEAPQVNSDEFDAVILNHCLQFFPAPADYVAEAKRRVAPGGRLILIGLQFFHDPRPKARSVAAQQQIYRKRYRAELFLFPNKGYLDSDDRERLSAQGIALRSYPQLWLANLKAWLNPALPEHAFGVWDS